MSDPRPERQITVSDNAEQSRYEVRVDGVLAGFAEYRDRGGRRILVHTEVDRAFGGQGIGNRLASGLLDDIKDRGLRAAVRCPFIRAFIARHPEYAV
ncbi:MAG: GNAT family N-acetyltransferase [Candidatus Limnocylindria bacterium]